MSTSAGLGEARTSNPGVRPHGSDPKGIAALGSAHAADRVRERAWPIALCFVLIAWTAVLFLVVRDHYVNFRLARYDLGNMVQAVWSTAHGRPLEVTHGTTGEQMTRLGGHVDPILAALAPLWIAVPSPLTLVAVQIAAVGLGAVPVFWLARRHLGSERAAGLLAFAYLAYPWVAWTAVDVFHPVTLAIPLLLFAVWFLDSERYVLFALCAGLAITTGELIGMFVAALGLWYALARGRRREGLAIAVAGAASTLVALFVVVPAFSGGPSAFYGAYEEVGGSPWGILQTAFSDPGAILSAAGSGRDVLYLFLLAVPLGGAFLLAPGLAAVALPQLAANLLADWPSATDPHAHYMAGILPFLFAAVAIGLGRLSPARRLRAAGLVLTLSVAATVVAGPWPGALGGTPTFFQTDDSKERLGALREAVALVPNDAPVSSTNRIGAHLAARRYLYSVPVVGRAEWIVVDVSDPWIPRVWGGGNDADALERFRERIEREAAWEKVFEREGVLVFRKAPA